MECEKIKPLISAFLDQELEDSEKKSVSEHLAHCSQCDQYRQSIQEAWESLGELEPIAPEEGYISRFWTQLSLKSPWYTKLFDGIDQFFKVRKLAPVYSVAMIFLIIGLFYTRNYIQSDQTAEFLATVDQSDLQMMENIEFVENLEVIEDIEFLEDFETIDSLDNV